MIHVFLDCRFPASQDDVYAGVVAAAKAVVTSMGPDCALVALRGPNSEHIPSAQVSLLRCPGIPVHASSGGGSVNIFLQSLQGAIRAAPAGGRIVLVTQLDVTAALNTVLATPPHSSHTAVTWLHIATAPSRPVAPSATVAFRYRPSDVASMSRAIHDVCLAELSALRGGAQRATVTVRSMTFQCEAVPTLVTDRPFPASWAAHSVVPMDTVDEAWLYGVPHLLVPANGANAALSFFDALDNANVFYALVQRMHSAGTAMLLSALLPSERLWAIALPPDPKRAAPTLLVRWVASQHMLRGIPKADGPWETTPYAEQKVDAAVRELPHCVLDVLSLCSEGSGHVPPTVTAAPGMGGVVTAHVVQGESAVFAMGALSGRTVAGPPGQTPANTFTFQRKTTKPRATKF